MDLTAAGPPAFAATASPGQLVPSPVPPALASTPRPDAPATPFSASLTGAVTPLSDARVAAAGPAPTPLAGNGAPIPAPIESTVGRSPQTIVPPGPPPVDNRPAVDTHAAGGPLLSGDAADRRLARRRRRSASLLPPLPSPMDIPEDAPGRVAFLAAGSAADFVPVTAVSADMAPALEPATAPSRPAPPVDEWLAMAIVGVAMLVVFVAGLLLTR